jgi:aspartate kinase
MKIYKFGGASVKDADGVKNLLRVLNQTQEKELVVVLSAMGKTTNALENVVTAYLENPSLTASLISEIYTYHTAISQHLFEKNHAVFTKINTLFEQLKLFLKTNKSNNKNFVYDQVVPFGELLSTTIVFEFLRENLLPITFLDARRCIITNANYREGIVNWEASQKQIEKLISPKQITITQGFIGSEPEHYFSTTLGREGSDYTAAIFAYCLQAESVTIWKDVPGVLNADPRYFKSHILLNHISYREAIELAFYGASVIHPKTIQPLQRKEIPLFVKSFKNPLEKGTRIFKGVALDPVVPCYILKKNQVLISLSSLDFSFMAENHIGQVFKLLHSYKMKVNVIQNSAISFSVCVDNTFNNLQAILPKLREQFNVKWNENVTLYTLRHAKKEDVEKLIAHKKMLLKLESRETIQLVIAQEN